MPTCLRKRTMKVNMLKFIYKSSFFIILILFISYFFVGLFNFQEKILSLEKNRNIVKKNPISKPVDINENPIILWMLTPQK